MREPILYEFDGTNPRSLSQLTNEELAMVANGETDPYEVTPLEAETDADAIGNAIAAALLAERLK